MKSRNDIEEELVCEYLVSVNRKQLWICELDMLDMLEKTAVENNFNYFLIFGSALGAARHHGFIPWDDDIDIGMLREDFEIFRNCNKHFFPSYISIEYGLYDKRTEPLLRIRDSRTTGIIKGEEGIQKNKGAFIEIYVYDSITQGKEHDRNLKRSKHLTAILNSPSEKTAKAVVLKMIYKLVGQKRLWQIFENVCREQERNNADNDFVNLVSLPKYGTKKKFWIAKSLVQETVHMPFEYTKVRVPKGNHEYLTQIYGDYMALPPVEKRGLFHDNVVFYDPNRSYQEYESSDIPQRYFSGDSSLNLL